MAWSQVKHYAKSNNRDFTLAALQKLVDEGFREVTPQKWSDLIKYTHEKVEDVYSAADRLENWKNLSFMLVKTMMKKRNLI